MVPVHQADTRVGSTASILVRLFVGLGLPEDRRFMPNRPIPRSETYSEGRAHVQHRALDAPLYRLFFADQRFKRHQGSEAEIDRDRPEAVPRQHFPALPQ